MPGDFNRAMILGRLVNDPRGDMTEAGGEEVFFTIATSDRWKDQKSGQWKEKTQYIPVKSVGKVALACIKYLRKASTVLVEGVLVSSRSTSGADVCEVFASNVQFVDQRKKDEDNATQFA